MVKNAYMGSWFALQCLLRIMLTWLLFVLGFTLSQRPQTVGQWPVVRLLAVALLARLLAVLGFREVLLLDPFLPSRRMLRGSCFIANLLYELLEGPFYLLVTYCVLCLVWILSWFVLVFYDNDN